MLTELLEKHKDQKVKLTPSHLKALIQGQEKYAFLEFLVEDVEDLDGVEGTKKPKAPKDSGPLKKRPAKKSKPANDDDMEDEGNSGADDDSSED